jgi:D-glycerate 3-kinase
MQAMAMSEAIRSAKEKLDLPDSYEKTVKKWLMPVVDELVSTMASPGMDKKQGPLMLGVQGSQGSGKTTCSEFIKILLENKYCLKSVVISIDDFYLTRAERCHLSKTVHPLLKTRGVPGTHDVSLALDTLQQLRDLRHQGSVFIPRFDKAIDDRLPKSNWSKITSPVDVIILEGWCVGLQPQEESSLMTPVNQLEKEEDPDLIWRSYVNEALSGEYQAIFNQLDKLLVLKAPSFECVYKWRKKQEQKLIASLDKNPMKADSKVLSDKELKRFVQHYERLTNYGLDTLSNKADWCLHLDANQRIEKLDRAEHVRFYSKETPYVVFTDLDGTLLDHYSYSWGAAAESLKKLENLGIPTIINTSKTAPEVVALQKRMGITAPFIVENGSALYLPFGFCDALVQEFSDVEEYNGFYVLVFGKHRQEILHAVYNERAAQGLKFTGFYDWSVEQIMENTGLDKEAAQGSMARDYSEPFIWQDSGVAYSRFAESLEAYGVRLLTGGRFEHAIGNTDKAKPIRFLKNRLFNNIDTKIVCLGDTSNDIAMLELADIPVCVKSPVAKYPKLSHACAYHTEEVGPKGWSEAIEKILEGKI